MQAYDMFNYFPGLRTPYNLRAYNNISPQIIIKKKFLIYIYIYINPVLIIHIYIYNKSRTNNIYILYVYIYIYIINLVLIIYTSVLTGMVYIKRHM